jgi:exonuclease III
VCKVSKLSLKAELCSSSAKSLLLYNQKYFSGEVLQFQHLRVRGLMYFQFLVSYNSVPYPAILVHKRVARIVVKKIVYNDRIIAIKLQVEPINILMIQVYMPTSEHEDNKVEELYGVIEEILEEDGKGNTHTIIMGDWNSVVGDEPYRNIVGPNGQGRKNHKGQMLINFYERNGLIVTNTGFKKPKRRLYTWKAPGDRSRHQLNYILVKHQFRNSVKDVQTLPGADINSDHNLLVTKI